MVYGAVGRGAGLFAAGVNHNYSSTSALHRHIISSLYVSISTKKKKKKTWAKLTTPLPVITSW